ncbi:MAG: NYN domain-containing protein [Patescibacteria group bacterium]
MGRQAFGADKVMSAVLACEQEAGGPGKEIRNPIRAVRAQIFKGGEQLGDLTLRRYLQGLWDKGFIQIIEGGGNGREWVGATVLMRTVPENVSAPKKNAAKKPELIVTSEPKRSVVAVLVDYDNAESGAKDAGFRMSFFKLKEHLRTFGDIWMADVYLSPFSARKDGVITQLWAAGFQAISCPMGTKEKDSVDSQINWRARQYLEIQGVDVVVIVSRDSDFNPLAVFAADRHKKVIFVDVAAEKMNVRGVDQEVEIPHSREYESFQDAYKFLENSMSPSDVETIKRFDFIKDIINSLRDQVKPQSFKGIQSVVELKLQAKWGDQFARESFRQALSVLVDSKVIIQMVGAATVQYRINQDHTAYINATYTRKH